MEFFKSSYKCINISGDFFISERELDVTKKKYAIVKYRIQHAIGMDINLHNPLDRSMLLSILSIDKFLYILYEDASRIASPCLANLGSMVIPCYTPEKDEGMVRLTLLFIRLKFRNL